MLNRSEAVDLMNAIDRYMSHMGYGGFTAPITFSKSGDTFYVLVEFAGQSDYFIDFDAAVAWIEGL